MDLSPPSLIRSPSSSRNSTYSRSPSLSVDYPPSDFVDPSFYKVNSVYDQSCSGVSSAMDPGNPHHRLDATTSAEWAEATAIHSVPQGVLSSDYVPYVGYDSAMHASYSHDLYSAQLAHAPALSYAPSPLASMSSRSPDPTSSRHSISYHSTSPMPRIKLEGGQEYSSGGELSQYPSPRSAHALMAEPGSYGSQAGSSGYLSDAPSGSWAKSDYPPIDADQYFASGSGNPGPLASDRRQQQQQQQASRPPRPAKRPIRRLTSKEEANFQCEVEGCGKLFSRSYNYKAHMETHDKKREYPFTCTFEDCSKKFVRKTDLQRHHQSVHMKEKNHKCDYCGRHFARKDTLRRHMEDGCSKRFDIGTMDLRGPESYDNYSVPIRTVPSSSGHLVAPPPHLPSMSLPRGGHDQGMSDVPPYMKR